MNLERFPYGPPELEILPGKQKYPFRMKKDFVYCWPGDKEFRKLDVVVPATYCTDLYSIPRMLWPVLSPFGEGCWGAICHDALYGTEWGLPGESIKTRAHRANKILRQAAIDSGCSPFKAWIIYQGVELGGAATWKDHDPAEVSEDLVLMAQAIERWEKADRPSPD